MAQALLSAGCVVKVMKSIELVVPVPKHKCMGYKYCAYSTSDK